MSRAVSAVSAAKCITVCVSERPSPLARLLARSRRTACPSPSKRLPGRRTGGRAGEAHSAAAVNKPYFSSDSYTGKQAGRQTDRQACPARFRTPRI